MLVQAQEPDTFFLAKKKGLLGRLGRSISSDDFIVPEKIVNPYLRFQGKKIASIQIVGLGFENSNEENDSTVKKPNLFKRAANSLHVTSNENFIKSNLFFKEGDYVIPLLVSDNERFLREQEFFQDARIILKKNNDDESLVDIIVYTQDVFSIGGKLNIRSAERVEVQVKEENFLGTGSRISFSSMYDAERSPTQGFGGEYLKRNIFSRFLNAKAGFSTFQPALVTGLAGQTSFYAGLEKPLVHRYKKWTGSFDVLFNKSLNTYRDSLFNNLFRYDNIQLDAWAGYNVGSIRRSFLNILKSYTSFLAVRSLYVNYNEVPGKYQDTFNYNFANINGFLFSYNLFRQNFYRTSFIYGFGRNEDLPEGLSLSLTAGWTNKDGKRRNYYGFDVEQYYLSKKGKYFTYYVKGGGFTFKNRFEDVDVLVGGTHFTNLKKLNANWRRRNFYSVSFSKQFSHLLNSPLFLQSQYGLPYFRNVLTEGSLRSAIKGETVFYNLKKVLGFRFAPFFFTDLAMITPRGNSIIESSFFSAHGGGFRTRNENLVFGTIEVKGYVFPRTVGDMKWWRVDVTTNLRFKYNSTFIKRPDFVVIN